MRVDGEDVDLSERVGYKGIMFSGVPNLAIAIGYTNASWTLKCDLTALYVCRLLNHMDEHGYAQCTPRWPEPELPDEPFLDLTVGLRRSARSTSSPSRGRGRPGGCTRTTPATSSCSSTVRSADEAMIFSTATGHRT